MDPDEPSGHAPSWCTSTPYTVVVVYNVAWVNPDRQTELILYPHPETQAGINKIGLLWIGKPVYFL